MSEGLRLTVARRIAAPVSDAWVRTVVAAALRGAKSKLPAGVGVVFIGNAEMRRYNRSYRGKDKTTDVLSFSVKPQTEGWSGDGELGDILISIPQTRRQSAANGRSFREELAMLLVHGSLHLLGYDHERPSDARAMLPLQNRILAKLGYD